MKVVIIDVNSKKIEKLTLEKIDLTNLYKAIGCSVIQAFGAYELTFICDDEFLLNGTAEQSEYGFALADWHSLLFGKVVVCLTDETNGDFIGFETDEDLTAAIEFLKYFGGFARIKQL